MSTISLNNVPLDPAVGQFGSLMNSSGPTDNITVLNAAGQGKQTTEYTLSGAFTVGIDFTIILAIPDLGVILQDVTYTTDGTEASLDEVATGLANQINLIPAIAAAVIATGSGSSKLLLTGRNSGFAFGATSAGGNTGTPAPTTVAAASAASIRPGRAIAFVASTGISMVGGVPSPSLYAAQVDTGVITNDASKIVHWSIELNGVKYAGTATSGATATLTADALEAAINTVMPADTVLASSPGADIVLTAEVAGYGFESFYYFEDSTGLIANTSTRGIGTDAVASLLGVAEFVSDIVAQAPGDSEAFYEANRPMAGIRGGSIWIDNSASPLFGDAVYLELAVGVDAGKF